METAEWQCVEQLGERQCTELYVAPDDQWQANDVASLCPADVEHFARLSSEIMHRAAAGTSWHDLELERDGDTS